MERTCGSDGSWSGPEPTCRRTNCPISPNVANAFGDDGRNHVAQTDRFVLYAQFYMSVAHGLVLLDVAPFFTRVAAHLQSHLKHT